MLQKNARLLIVIAVFTTLYGLITFVNHYLFRTYALDLGLYTNALYKYAHFKAANSEMIHEFSESILGGHFSLYLILFSPLVWIFGTYTLLIVQLIFIVIGGIGVHKFVREFINDKLALSAAIFFFAFYGVFSAVAFDYHNNVIASAVLPWFLYYFQKKSFRIATLLLIFMLIGKENIAIWLFFVILGLLIQFRHEKGMRNILFIYGAVCVGYFILVIDVIVPYYSSSSDYRGFLYSSLGDNYFDALKTLVSHPIDSVKVLFTNHLGDPQFDYIKAEFWVIILLSGLYFLLRKPIYLIMLLPIFAQKLFHDKESMWGIGYHYSIEFAPILAIGIFAAINEFKKSLYRKISIALALVGVFGCTIHIMDNTIAYADKSRIRLYQAKHYKKSYDAAVVHRMLKTIPSNSKVSALSPFIPHLALRDHIYQYPIVKDAEYIVLSTDEIAYPLTDELLSAQIEQLKTSNDWFILKQSASLIIFKKEFHVSD